MSTIPIPCHMDYSSLLPLLVCSPPLQQLGKPDSHYAPSIYITVQCQCTCIVTSNLLTHIFKFPNMLFHFYIVYIVVHLAIYFFKSVLVPGAPWKFSVSGMLSNCIWGR